jgi:arginine N-succinyltransferase
MLCVRPVSHSDLTSIEKLMAQSELRSSTLPLDRDRLSEKIDSSVNSFAGSIEEGRERFLFVLEDLATGEILGTSGIDACAGNGGPFYNYRSDELIHSSHTLNVFNKVPVLYLTHELTGKTLLCSFTLGAALRETAAFELLSRARFLFIRQFQERFNDRIIVEIQGVQDDKGQSPFWDSLGRHFFNMDFATADYYSSIKSKTFIAEMMPPHPIYVPLLTPAAREVMSKHHPGTESTCQMLAREGFSVSNYIDIFDGGPTLEARIKHISTIKNAKCKQIKKSDSGFGMKYLISNNRFSDFRCVIGQTTDGLGDIIRLHSKTAESLAVDDGDTVSFVAL